MNEVKRMGLYYMSSVSRKKDKNIVDYLFLKIFKYLRNLIFFRKIKYIQSDGNNVGFLDSFQHTYRFVTFIHLTAWINLWLKDLDKNYDLIIGIPRSGLMVASMLATKMGKPLSTPDVFLQKKTYWQSTQVGKRSKIKKILVVDDCVFNAKELTKNVKLIKEYVGNKTVVDSASLILVPNNTSGKAIVDHYYKLIDPPFVLEWNLTHAKRNFLNKKVCFDLDGVLCDECPVEVDGDELKYKRWIKEVRPNILPNYKIDTIVTNRLEKYRTETEVWLKKHGVKYDHLNMWNIKSKQERKNDFAKRKVDVVTKIKPDLFVESRFDEASEIYIRTGTPTIAIDKMIMFS